MYLLLSAMEEELRDILGALSHPEEHTLGPVTAWTGELAGRRVAAARSGVGKVMSAMVTQALIAQLRPQALVFTGLAGSLRPGIVIGDTLIATDCVQHDLDVSGLGLPRGTIPWTPWRFIHCDPSLVALASTYLPTDGTVHLGRICTGDQFVGPGNRAALAYLVTELEGHAVEMEGAAVGTVAACNGLPFLLVRTISDSADEHAAVRFDEFLPRASRNSLDFLHHLLPQLPA